MYLLAFNTISRTLTIGLALIALLLMQCGSGDKSQPVQEEILVKINDRTISVSEFIKRAEYTIRPGYCKYDYPVHKKIVLNSLIAEKLFAIEAGDDNGLMSNAHYQNYMRGRKEQAMRQLFFHDTAFKKAVPDTNEIKQIYHVAGRTYNLSYLSLKDEHVAGSVRNLVEQGKSFDEIFRENGGISEIPTREVKWEIPENPVIYDKLFRNAAHIKKGQMIGPIEVEPGFYQLIRVDGWTDRMAMSDAQIVQRWEDVTERIRTEKAEAIFDKYVTNLMRGKNLELAGPAFKKLVEIVGPQYLQTNNEKKAAFNSQYWGKEQNDMPVEDIGNMEKILDEPLFRENGEVWTVREFTDHLQVHPLVFRTKAINKGNFAEQYKLAIADMIRDKYITEDAYAAGYGTRKEVTRTMEMWEDNMLMMYERNNFLKRIGAAESFTQNYMNVLHDTLNAYVDSLQEKYSGQIFINTDAFDEIKLSRIDMFAFQNNVPFPIIVPSFPVLTDQHPIDYGNKLQENSK